MNASALPGPLLALVAIYFAASLGHFSHNAEYIAVYPGMPGWITRDTVYLVWLGITGLGFAGLLMARLKLPAAALLFIGAYGGMGLDGLAHYTLALCSEHTFVANLTIWSEAATGLALLLVSAVLLARRISPVLACKP